MFLVNMPCCSPSLSFYIFECMTGYLGLFGAKAEDCIYRFDRKNKEDIFLRIANEDNAVIQFAKDIISDFQTVKVRRSEKYADSRDEEDLPLSLCYFVANFQRKLSPDAQDKKGHLEVLRALSELSSGDDSW